jgi:hypothetical protein
MAASPQFVFERSYVQVLEGTVTERVVYLVKRPNYRSRDLLFDQHWNPTLHSTPAAEPKTIKSRCD